MLTCSNKWSAIIKNVKVNDTGIVKEQNLPWNPWKLGRVSEVMASQDGLVKIRQ